MVSCAARRTATFHRPTIKPPDVFRGAEKNTATEAASIGDLKWFEVFKDEELQRLMRAGVPLDGVADHGVSEALYLRDPDGNGVELYWDRPREAWPKDEKGALTMFTRSLDLGALLAAAEAGGSSSGAAHACEARARRIRAPVKEPGSGHE